MGAGRPRLTTKIKELKGTLQPCRTNPDEPVSLPGMPQIPKGLNHLGKKKFQELAAELYQMQVITTHDVHILEMIAHQWENYIELKKELKKNGRFYHSTIIETNDEGTRKVKVTQSKMKAHPALAAYQQAWTNIIKGLQDLGLTPATRSKLKVVKKEQEDPLAKLLGG